jgi:hypothetical protein
MDPNMERPPPDQDDPRYIAKRLFEALSAQYPDKYIALIQPREVADELLPAAKLATGKATAAPQKPITLQPRDH